MTNAMTKLTMKATICLAITAALLPACSHRDRGPAPATAALDPTAPGSPGTLEAGMVRLFDGATLEGWDGNPGIWSVRDGAIFGASDKGGELIVTTGDYSDFRLLLRSRMVKHPDNHLGVCFWGDRPARGTWGYNNCLLVNPTSGGMWDYHPGKGDVPRTMPNPRNDRSVWHHTEILVRRKPGTVRVAVDGVEVVNYTDPDPTRLKHGPIGLQIHAGRSEVAYKDLFIEIDPPREDFMTMGQFVAVPKPAP
jgi:hypothetical protein